MSRHAARPFALVATVVLFAGAMPGGASAAELFRFDYQGAAAVCQPSQPSYAAGLRSRPLGLVNEGNAVAFVACAFRGDPTPGGRGAWQVTATVGNVGTASRTVSCSFVNGRQVGSDSNAVYRTKTFNVFPGSQGATFTWEPSEIAGAPESIDRPAVLCSLPKGTALHYIATYYDENIGN